MPDIRIAAMIQAHHRPENLRRLLQRLSGPLWRPLVHLDAKSDLRSFAGLLDDRLMTRRRVPVRWGGLSSVRSILILLEEALQRTDATHFYLMSGQCFPIKSDEHIERAVDAAPPGRGNWIARRPMPSEDKPLDRITRLWPYDVPTPVGRRVAGAILRRMPADENRLRGLRPFGGSAWWLLERSAVIQTLAFLKRERWLLSSLRASFIPDEFFFQTVTAHLGIHTSGDGPTAAIWKPGSPHPEVITASNFTSVASRSQFVARKFADFYPDE